MSKFGLKVAFLAIGMGTLGLAGFATELKAADIDELQRQFSHRGFVDNARLFAPKEDTKLAAVEALRNSREPGVGAMIAALQPALDRIQQARKIETRTTEVNAELQRKYGPSFFEILDAASSPNRNEIDAFVRSGRISSSDAEELHRDAQEMRDGTTAKFLTTFTATLSNSLRANVQTRLLRSRAEVWVGRAEAKALPEVLRARAGGALARPSLDVKVGAALNVSASDAGHEAFLIVESHDERELTRVTLLLEITTNSGSRYAAVYLPKLAARGRFRSGPIALNADYLSESPVDWQPKLSVEKTVFSIWCDEFQTEGMTPALLSDQELFWELRLGAAAPGAVFVSDVAYFATEKPGKFELHFVKLERLAKDFRVEVKLVDNDSKRTKVFRGPLQIPAAPAKPKVADPRDEAKMDLNTLMESRRKTFREKMAQAKPKGDLVATLKSGAETLELGLDFDANSTSSWQAFGGPLNNCVFLSSSVIPSRGSPEAIARQRYSDALRMGGRGEFEDCEKALRQMTIDFAGTEWEEKARVSLERLPEWKQSQFKLAEAKRQAEQRQAEEVPLQLLTNAQILTSQGQFAGAKTAYEQLRKEYRGTPWENKAADGLKLLEVAKKEAEARAKKAKQKPSTPKR